MRESGLLGALVLIAMSSPGRAQATPASVDDVGQAIDACLRSVTSGGVDLARLTSAGWAKPPEPPIGTPRYMTTELVHSRAGNEARIWVTNPRYAVRRVCSVHAPIPNVTSYAGFANGLNARYGASIKRGDTAYLWRRRGRTIVLTQAGRKDQPGVRVDVTATAQEKK